jgi:glycerophosphoryl diester phosphodiesterase
MNKLGKTVFQIIIGFVFLISSAEATPWVIAHRGGGQNYPENTILSFAKSLEMGCDALELDVQVTKDAVVVVYHPEDLKKWTNGEGSISSYNWDEIAHLNAGYNFKLEEEYPFRSFNLKIPKLEEVLEKFPKTFIIIDMKSLPAESLINALVETVSDEESERLIFYSTNAEHIDLLFQQKPHWKTFEKRDLTRQRLLELNQTGQSDLPLNSNWIGFELKRKMVVTESFALGKGTSSLDFYLWSLKTISILKEANPNISIVLFGINKKEEWIQAVNLGVSAVYTDNPYEILKLKNAIMSDL